MDSNSKCREIIFRLLDHKDSTNELINQKILLYRWIKPEHLELKVNQTQLEPASQTFKSISGYSTPTEKISCMMAGIEELHRVIGKNNGQEEILPSIIYCLIKSESTNIGSETQFMTLYRRRSLSMCYAGCSHRFEINCNCIQKKVYDEKEVTYYLTSMQAAIDFIKRMEYYDLKICEIEFNQNIADAIGLMRQT